MVGVHRGQRQATVLAAVFLAVIATDQAAKWLAWRYLPWTVVNEGGYILLSPRIRAWFAAPTSGAVANAVGFGLILVGLAWLMCRPRPDTVVAAAGAVAAGWASNLLDRVALHGWSAPGSNRGVVDFIPTGGISRCNVADLWIVAGVLTLCVIRLRRIRVGRHPTTRPQETGPAPSAESPTSAGKS